MNTEAKAQAIADCLNEILAPQQNRWRLGPTTVEPHWGPSSSDPGTRALAMSEVFGADARFQALRLGTWLGTPDGELFSRAVEILLPPPYNHEASIVVDALRLAAQAQHEQVWNAVLKKVGIGIGVSLVTAGIGRMFNGYVGQVRES